MRIDEVRPASEKKSAEYDEEHETDMNDDDDVREDAIHHVLTNSLLKCKLRIYRAIGGASQLR